MAETTPEDKDDKSKRILKWFKSAPAIALAVGLVAGIPLVIEPLGFASDYLGVKLTSEEVSQLKPDPQWQRKQVLHHYMLW